MQPATTLPTQKRRQGERGVEPLSALNRDRLLKDLDARAKQGDVAAAIGILIVGTIIDSTRNAQHG